jgi:hypothetical protein
LTYQQSPRFYPFMWVCSPSSGSFSIHIHLHHCRNTTSTRHITWSSLLGRFSIQGNQSNHQLLYYCWVMKGFLKYWWIITLIWHHIFIQNLLRH